MCQTPAEPMPKISDLLAESLVGAQVTIRQFYEGCTWTDVDNEYAFTGWIKSEQTKYDESEIVLTVSPQKAYTLIPPYKMHQDDYDTMDKEGEGIVMPVILGELINDGKESHNSLVEMDAAYGGALLLDTKYIRYDAPDFYLLVSMLQSKDVPDLYKDNVAQAADSREILSQVWGMRWYGSGWFELDNTSALLNFDDYLWSAGLKCDGLIKSQMTMTQYFTKMMGQFPFHVYRGRDGKIYFKKWERKPAVDYTEKKLSYEDEIFDIKISYSNPKGPGISMKFWPNLGRSMADAVAPGGYFQRAFVEMNVQDSGHNLDEDLTDSELEWTLTGSGTFPITGDLIMVGREICEVRLPAAPSGSVVTVWRRGGNGTDAVEHSDGDVIYILRTDSSNGRCRHDQMGNIASPCEKIEIWEDAAHTAVVQLSNFGYSNHAKLFYDAQRLANALADCCTSHASLTGTYACLWDAETNFFKLYTTDSTEFKILQDQSDNLTKVLGWWVDTGMATEHWGDRPARKRECQLTYDYAMHRNNRVQEIVADLIVGTGLTYESGGSFGGDLTPQVARDYRYDISHRPMKQVSLSAPNRFYNLLIGKTFEFDTDINDYLKVHGQNFTDLNWRVINARRVDMNTLRFVVEEAT
jgi:hypothetical protein